MICTIANITQKFDKPCYPKCPVVGWILFLHLFLHVWRNKETYVSYTFCYKINDCWIWQNTFLVYPLQPNCPFCLLLLQVNADVPQFTHNSEWIVGSPYSEAEEQLLKKKTFFHSKWVVSNLNIMTNRVFVPNWKIMKGHVAVAFVSTKDDIYPSGLGSL